MKEYDYVKVGSRLFGAIFANMFQKENNIFVRENQVKYQYYDMDDVIKKAFESYANTK